MGSTPAALSDGGDVGGSALATTHWSVVLAAGQASGSAAQAALESLCRSYWYPLYAYVRRTGRDSEEAKDLTQEFFALLEQVLGRLSALDSAGRALERQVRA